MRPDLRERAATETLCSMRQRARPSLCCGLSHGVTAAVNVSVSPGGFHRLVEPACGDSVDELLRYVDVDPDEMLITYLRWPREQGVSEAGVDSYHCELKAALRGHTCLGS